MNYKILIATCLFSNLLFAQNLINNPSLENLKPYPYVVLEDMWGTTFHESIHYASGGWFRAWRSPDLVNELLSDHNHYFNNYYVMEFDSLDSLI